MADVENFHFEDFVGDYYLSKDVDGVSRLKVEENFTAIFPDFEQNKGICRNIPFTNQNGANVTLPSLTKDNITVLRNGEPEPIYSLEKSSNFYQVCTGTDDYLLGAQKYSFIYDFTKVATGFNGKQELYWDVNGNAWPQKFDKVTANVHLADDVLQNYTGNSWCYVGTYGEKGSERCEITKIDDGASFSVSNLDAYENVTFDMEFNDGTFVIPTLPYAIVLGIALLIGLVSLIKPIKKLIKSREKAKFFKGIFVKPEYQPSKEYSLSEMQEIYIGKKKDVKVGLLLDMLVKKKISIVKKSQDENSKTWFKKKNAWALKLNNVSKLEPEERTLLTILNGGKGIDGANEIEIKKYSPNNNLVLLDKKFTKTIAEKVLHDGLVKEKYTVGEARRSASNSVASALSNSFLMVLVTVCCVFVTIGMLGDSLSGVLALPGHFFVVLAVIVGIFAFIWNMINSRANRFINFTDEGLRASKYMDGLKLYISMAEAERLKMLQSIDGADVSPAGIVKIYEKLLPYAAVFGLEESWMKEMEQYCKVEELEEPDWLPAGFVASDISNMTSYASSIVNAATVMSANGGGLSSGSSGGGGGGFSGGGGGGGGGGGR